MTVYQLNQVKVSYDNRNVLDINSLTIETGECIALLGQNGAGKSTLLNLFAFLAKPSQGEVALFNEHTSQVLSPALRRQIGYVNQHPYPLSGTVIDNLQLALTMQGVSKSQHKSLIDDALNKTRTRHLANQQTNTLSGGELKRAAIARAIVYQPKILLLDEPFSHLDTRSSNELENVIETLAREAERTIVFSTHNQLQGLNLASRSITLVEGKPTETPLLNLFSGRQTTDGFQTGQLLIEVTQHTETAKHIAIHPNDIILSLQPFSPSSMRNQFKGRVVMIAEQRDTVRVEIDCGERFQTIISQESHHQFNIQLGDNIWLGFKASAVEVF